MDITESTVSTSEARRSFSLSTPGLQFFTL
jgi:hypothetical protein